MDKNAILGMPFGTAQNRLRKNILFSILARIGENRCFKCGETIAHSDVLSIEHKVPWDSPALFWDLDNIAFSHRACNTRQTFPPPSHGTERTYFRHRCRCDRCRLNHNARINRNRTALRSRNASVAQLVVASV